MSKTKQSATHATLVFERRVPAPIVKVFEALADPAKRAEWSTPSETAIVIYDESNFAVGGMDRFRCGSKQNPNIQGTTCYLDIILGQRIVSSELIEMDGNRLSASLSTMELTAVGGETQIKTTIQVVSFYGQDMIKDHEAGYNGSHDSLVNYFSR